METMESIIQRKTTWQYEEKPVEEEKLMQILEAARWAPSGANLQPWDYVVITDENIRPKMVEIIKKAHRLWMTDVVPEPRPEHLIKAIEDLIVRYTKKPVIFIVCCHTQRDSIDPARKADPKYTKYMDHQSIGASIQNLMLAATSLGLATHWIGCAVLTQDELRGLLNIPQTTEIVAILTLGYPSENSNMRGEKIVERTRLPLDSIIHFNTWK